MKNLIENSISWDRLGKRSKSEYEFGIEKASISSADSVFTIDLHANFVMPYDDILKMKAIIKSQVPELSDVNFTFRYENVVQTNEEIIKLFVEHMIAIVNGQYAGITRLIIPDMTKVSDGVVNIYAVGQKIVEDLNAQVAKLFEQLLKENFGIKDAVLFLNDDERYESAITDISEIEKETIKNPPQPVIAKKPSAPKEEKGGGWRKKQVKDEVEGNKIMGKRFSGDAIPLGAVTPDSGMCIIEGILFKMEERSIRQDLKLVSLLITDKKTTFCAKAFVNLEKFADLEEHLKPGCFLRIRGMAEDDQYDHMIIVKAKDILKEDVPQRMDTNETGKRVELHLHTNMSQMDGLNDPKSLVKQAIKWGHPAIAITDHGVVQSFPDAAKAAGDDIKVIFGLEGYVFDDSQYRNEDGTIDYKSSPTNHIILLAKTQEGLKNLYKLVSYSHLHYFYKKPRLPWSVIEENREGLIIGSACCAGELFTAMITQEFYSKKTGTTRVKEALSHEEQLKIASRYDYLEIQPNMNNRFMFEKQIYFEGKRVENDEDLRNIDRRIVELAQELGKPVVATTDTHYKDPDDAIYRNIIMAGMGFDDESSDGLYMKTTDEMLDEFSYLGPEMAHKVVIDYPNAIADMVDEGIVPVPKTGGTNGHGKFPPKIEGAEEILRSTCYKNAHDLYGDPLPDVVQARLDRELSSVIDNGYAVMYVSAQMLVQKSLSDGYLVGSRGSVGSSFAATMAGITEVNPLPPHYLCSDCKYLEWGDENLYDCGVDMPRKNCPNCGKELDQLGFTIPFETFLGFKGNKEPDIDLNFAGEYQPRAHKYVGEIFGEKNVFKAGTVGTVAEKTAYGYVMKYSDERNLGINKYEADRLTLGCTGIKRTTGQHPGGIIICPDDHEIYEFTPVQHPANDTTTDIVTTHFDYHKIDENLLKLDILGHDVPSMIRHLQDMTGVDPFDVPLKDEAVNSLFLNADALKIIDPEYRFRHGSFGIPEFGTKFTRQMLDDTQPSRFGDLVRISGFSHGTDVWINNAHDFIVSGEATMKDAISTRDDIMNYLILKGLPNDTAFKIMENVRKGKVAGGKCKEWPEWKEMMQNHDVPNWYIESCNRIKYMFPRAHAVAYVMMSYRIAWFKVYYPVNFYAAYFTTKVADFPADVILSGKDAVLRRYDEIQAMGNNATAKEENEMIVLEVAYEMYCRGFEFQSIILGESDGVKFYEYDGKVLLPYMAISGVGESAARSIADEYKKKPFDTVEELRERTKLSKTNIDKLREMGVLKGMPETDQLSLF